MCMMGNENNTMFEDIKKVYITREKTFGQKLWLKSKKNWIDPLISILKNTF